MLCNLTNLSQSKILKITFLCFVDYNSSRSNHSSSSSTCSSSITSSSSSIASASDISSSNSSHPQQMQTSAFTLIQSSDGFMLVRVNYFVINIYIFYALMKKKNVLFLSAMKSRERESQCNGLNFHLLQPTSVN